jgi:hypothetical protein
MLSATVLLSTSFGLFVGMLALLWLGRRIGARQTEEQAPAGIGLLDGAVFALLGFLVALSYSGAESRYQARRLQIVDEANTIYSAYQLVDLVPTDAQPKLRATFREYVDSRIAAFQKLPDIDAARTELERSQALQKDIWRQTIIAIRHEPTSTSTVMLPAMNRMADMATTRNWTAESHGAFVTLGLLFVLALVSSFLAGMAMGGKKTSWIHMIAFAAIFAATMYCMMDLEFPRAGVVQINDFDRALIDVRNSM